MLLTFVNFHALLLIRHNQSIVAIASKIRESHTSAEERIVKVEYHQ